MPDFDVERGSCRLEVRVKDGHHFVHWVQSEGDPLDYVRALKAAKAEAVRLCIEKLYFFIDPQAVRLMLLYARAGAKAEAVVMSYEVNNGSRNSDPYG